MQYAFCHCWRGSGVATDNIVCKDARAFHLLSFNLILNITEIFIVKLLKAHGLILSKFYYWWTQGLSQITECGYFV